MRLIVQVINGVPFVYRETETHFRTVEKRRGTTRLDPKNLDNECRLDKYGNCHFVFKVKKGSK